MITKATMALRSKDARIIIAMVMIINVMLMQLFITMIMVMIVKD